MTRSGETADDPDAVPGDLARSATLDAAMTGAGKVFLLCSAAHDELAWHRNAIDAAARAGVSHLVRSSILGAHPAAPARFIRRRCGRCHRRRPGRPAGLAVRRQGPGCTRCRWYTGPCRGGQDMAIAKTCSEGEPLARAPTGGRSTAASALAGSSGTVTEKMSAV